MQIIEDKALLLKVRDPSTVTDHIHRSAETKEGVLVKWGHTEAEILAELGFDETPSPMLLPLDTASRLLLQRAGYR